MERYRPNWEVSQTCKACGHQLSGPIPPELGSLSNLKVLELSQLTGGMRQSCIS